MPQVGTCCNGREIPGARHNSVTRCKWVPICTKNLSLYLRHGKKNATRCGFVNDESRKEGNSGPTVFQKLHPLRPMVLLSRLIHSERSTRRGACAVSHGLKQALRLSSHVREMAMKQVSILLTDHTRWGQGSSLPLPPIHSRNDSVWPAYAPLTDIYVIVFF